MSTDLRSLDNSQALIVGKGVGAMAVYDRVDPMAFVEKFGKVFWVSGAGGAKTQQEGELLALACLCERKTIFEINREFHLMDGKLSMRADAMLAKFRQIGGKHKWIKSGDDGQEAICDFTFDGQTTQVKYTIKDAELAGLVKDKSNWKKNPASMLRARVISNAIRMIAPEVVAGYYTPEENEDVAAERATAPAATAETAKAVRQRAKELKEMNSQSPTTSATSPAAGEVVDAEFTVTTEAKAEATSQANATPEAPANATTSVASQAADSTQAATQADQSAATPDASAAGSATTATLMQIEVLLTKAGRTKDMIEQQIRKNTPTFTTLDTLSENAASKLLANLEKQLAGKK